MRHARFSLSLLVEPLLQPSTNLVKHHVKKTMKEMEEALPTSLFFHLSRSYLIQLEAIEKINTQTLWMSNGQCIPIPKGKYRLLSKAFIAHHFKEAM